MIQSNLHIEKKMYHRNQHYECLLSLSEKSGITINDMTRFGTSLMRSENIHSYDLDARFFIDSSQYLTFFALNLPNAFDNENWPDEPFQFITPLDSNVLDAKLTKWEVTNIIDLFERRIAENIPVQYITNEAYYVNRTKFYFDENVNEPYSYFAGMFDKFLAQQEWNNFQVLDMCAGSGCMGISLALLMPSFKVDLVDISTEALSAAQKNIDMYNLNDRVRCIQSDLFSEVKNKYDMIITNPPWVEERRYDEWQKCEDRGWTSESKHQPRLALVSGKDGMDHINKILSIATEYLNHENASLIITEIPKKQANIIKQQYSNILFEEFLPVNYNGSPCKILLVPNDYSPPLSFRIEKKHLKTKN